MRCIRIEEFDNIDEAVVLIKMEDEPTISLAEKFIDMVDESLKTIVLYVSGKKSLPALLCMGAADLVYINKNTELCIKKEEIGLINDKFLSVLSGIMNRYILTDLIYTNRTISAEDALRLGMANSIAGYSEILARFKKIDNPPFAVKLLKRIMSINSGLKEKDARFVERMAFALSFCSSDQKEGMRAFLEKRKPEFKGR